MATKQKGKENKLIMLVGVLAIIAIVLELTFVRRYTKLRHNVDAFSYNIQQVQTEAQAADQIAQFMNATKSNIQPNSSQAGIFGWFKRLFTNRGGNLPDENIGQSLDHLEASVILYE